VIYHIKTQSHDFTSCNTPKRRKAKRLSLIAFFLFLPTFSYSQCNQLVCSDKFDGTSVDASKWVFQTGNGRPDLCGWGNGELENYTSCTNNTTVSNGMPGQSRLSLQY